MTTSNTDPRFGKHPPFDESPQTPPGIEAHMRIEPDFGESTYIGSGKLRDRVALITGGDSGIGRAVALAFAREGSHIALSYLEEEDTDAQHTKDFVEGENRRCLLFPGDIGNPVQIHRIVDETMRELGKLDILVNNAAAQTPKEFGEFTLVDLEATFRTNVFAPFLLSQAALEVMRPGASIINVVSIQAYQPDAMILPYACTKGALVTFTRGLSKHAIEKGVRVNAIAPGPVWTPLIVSSMPEDKMKEFGKGGDLGRPAQPAELAPSFVLLASNDGAFINGEVIGVTGGKFLT